MDTAALDRAEDTDREAPAAPACVAQRYSLRCRAAGCDSDRSARGSFCAGCGFGTAWLVVDDPDGPATLACGRCGGSASHPVPPAHCQRCGDPDAGWWDRESARWHVEDLSPLPIDGALATRGVWICGDFEGDLDGPVSALGPGIRSYRTRFIRGTLRNVRRVSGPPRTIAAPEPVPLRQPSAPSVRVHYDRGAPIAAEVELLDFRVHDWLSLGLAETGGGGAESGARMIGRARGTAYGLLLPPEEPRRPEVADAVPDPLPGALPTATPEAGAASYVAERWQAERPPAPEVGPRRDAASTSGWWLLLLALLFFWFAGGLLGALGAIAILGLAALARRLASRSTALPAVVARRPWLKSVLPAVVALLGIALLAGFAAHCQPGWRWALLLPVGAMLLAARWRAHPQVRRGLFVTAVLGLLLALPGLGAVCSAPGSGLRPPLASGGAFDALSARLESRWQGGGQWLDQQVAFDPATQNLAQLPPTDDGGRRLSIDDVLADPELLADCRNRIYFPNTSMFDLNSDRLNSQVEGQLRKLDRLRLRYADSTLVIIGHTDRVDTDTADGLHRNLMLSERRAQSVAQWLSLNTSWPAMAMEVQGAGSRFPVLDVPGDVPWNRRVEIRLQCRQP